MLYGTLYLTLLCLVLQRLPYKKEGGGGKRRWGRGRRRLNKCDMQNTITIETANRDRERSKADTEGRKTHTETW